MVLIYTPAEDSFLLSSIIRKYARGTTFLDMGVGSGIQTEAALRAGASSVCAVDIATDALRALKNKSVKTTLVHSNLFSKVRGTFNLIAFNPPYLPRDEREDAESARGTTGGKRGDEIILRFLKQSASYLTPDGIILLLLSSLTPKQRILALLTKQRMTHKRVASQKLFFEEIEVWKISYV